MKDTALCALAASAWPADRGPGWQQLLPRMLRSASHPSETVTIAAPAMLADTLIAPALPRLLQQDPSIRVRLASSRAADEFTGSLDATICLAPVDAPPALRAMRIATLRHVICASRELLHAHGEPRTPEDLDPEVCIGVIDARGEPVPWKLRNERIQITIHPTSPLVFGEPSSAVAAAVHGGGFVCALDLAVESQIAAGLLQPVLHDWRAPDHAVWLTYNGALTEELQSIAAFVAGLLPARTL